MAWYRQHLAAPANETRLSDVRAPVAVFQGEADPQTPIDEADRIAKARAGKTLVFRYPRLGHGFSPDGNGAPTLGPIADEVLRDIVGAAASF